MKYPLAAIFLLAAAPVLAQSTGVAQPPETVEDAAPIERQAAPVKVVTAPAIVVAPPDANTDAYKDASTQTAPASATLSSAASPAVTLQKHDLVKFQPDPDSGIVESVPQRSDEVAEGTILRARLRGSITTTATQSGAPFTAELIEPLMHMGRVVAPAGSLVQGRVTEIRGGKRIKGEALIHLQAEELTLPDGSRLPLRASVIDTDQTAENRTDSEGNILRKDHPKQTLAAASLATGSAAAAGGLIAGPAGALVGAGLGAGVSTVLWLKQDRQTQLPPDALLVLALSSPLRLTSPVREPNYSATPAQQPYTTPAEGARLVRRTPEPAAPQAYVPTN